MAEVAISLPFGLNAYGSVNFTQSQSKIWSDRVLSVIGTLVGERVMQTTFGTEIANSLFASTQRMEEVIPVEVEKAFATYLTELTLVDTIINALFITPSTVNDMRINMVEMINPELRITL